MTDLQELVGAVVILYLARCLRWVRADEIAFVATPLRGYHPVEPWTFLSNDKGGFVVQNPLPPFQPAVICRSIPFAIDSNGICGDDDLFIAFNEIRGVWAEKARILVNGRNFCRLGSDHAAEQFASSIAEFWQVPDNLRQSRIDEWLARSLDQRPFERQFKSYQRAASQIMPWCVGLFLLGLIILPTSISVPQIRYSWLVFGGLASLCWVANVIGFRSAHRRLWPDDHALLRKKTITMLAIPVASIRAADLLVPDGADSLATAAVICNEREFRQFARQKLLQLTFDGSRTVSRERVAVESTRAGFNAKAIRHYVGLVEASGFSIDQITERPAPASRDAIAYCPRCDTQYARSDGYCAFCDGVLLLPFFDGHEMEKRI